MAPVPAPGQVVSSEELFESVWGEKYMDSNNTVMSHIARLREKMHEPSRKPKFIKTVWGWATPLSKERKPCLAQRLQTDRGLYRALQRWGYYLLALMAWVTVVLAVSALGVLVCSRLTWYETDPSTTCSCGSGTTTFFCIAVVLLGWVVISWHFISRPVRQLDALIGASAQLTCPTEEPIRLPASMKSVEDQLNLAREEALRAQRPPGRRNSGKTTWVVYLAHDLKTPPSPASSAI